MRHLPGKTAWSEWHCFGDMLVLKNPLCGLSNTANDRLYERDVVCRAYSHANDRSVVVVYLDNNVLIIFDGCRSINTHGFVVKIWALVRVPVKSILLLVKYLTVKVNVVDISCLSGSYSHWYMLPAMVLQLLWPVGILLLHAAFQSLIALSVCYHFKGLIAVPPPHRFGLSGLRFWWGSPRPRSMSAGPTEAPCAPSVCGTGETVTRLFVSQKKKNVNRNNGC